MSDDITVVVEENPVVTVEVFEGAQGPKGDTGDTGPQGEQGETGATGPQGDPGEISQAELDAALAAYQAVSEKGEADGYAELDSAGKVPLAQRAGGLLAAVAYMPSATSLTTTSTSFVDADATNLAVTFTAPASGKVLIKLTARQNNATNGAASYWNIREGSSDVAGTDAWVHRGSTADDLNRISHSCVVSGLTPGSSHTYKWGHKTGSGGTSQLGLGDSSVGQAVMEVWECPS